MRLVAEVLIIYKGEVQQKVLEIVDVSPEQVFVNSKMAENVDEGNENDFKENDNVSQESEILRRNRPFIEYFKQEAKILREQGKKVVSVGAIINFH
ncbi:hypothetical protein WN944_000622 [Citrus x changshan-huyou]|uniref:Uncharacterized protein n=1 Tax=Citrus x changshan-huyou TaxID=2935761 RepID=A0AAP0MEY2_9ROSI